MTRSMGRIPFALKLFFFIENLKIIFPFSIISQHWESTGSGNPSLWKTRSRLSCIFNTVVAGGVATQWSRSSAASPGHQQTWYWLSYSGYSSFSIIFGNWATSAECCSCVKKEAIHKIRQDLFYVGYSKQITLAVHSYRPTRVKKKNTKWADARIDRADWAHACKAVEATTPDATII